MDSHEYGLELMKAMHRLRNSHARFSLGELKKGEFGILSMIEHFEQQTGTENVCASDLANQLDLMPPAVSRTLKGLEEKGYVERLTDKKDRRNTIIVITQEGLKARDEARNVLHEMMDHIMQTMGEEDIEILIQKLNRFSGLIEEEITKKRGE
ncbi:MAG: MarR family transcriptional regulator [Lachnospiraceae bacterium]